MTAPLYTHVIAFCFGFATCGLVIYAAVRLTAWEFQRSRSQDVGAETRAELAPRRRAS